MKLVVTQKSTLRQDTAAGDPDKLTHWLVRLWAEVFRDEVPTKLSRELSFSMMEKSPCTLADDDWIVELSC